MDDLEALRKEVELRYNVTLEKGDPLIAVMAVTLQLVSECLETVCHQNNNNHKVVINELQKLRAALREKSYPRGRVDNSSNVHPS